MSRWRAAGLATVLIAFFLGVGTYPGGTSTNEASAGGKPGARAQQSGSVRSGESPIPFAQVKLYRAGTHRAATGAALLGEARAGADGRFTIVYEEPTDPDAVLYLLAEGKHAKPGPGPVELAAVLDNATIPAEVVVNERTTVATAYAMAQFTDGRQIGGPDPGLPNAAGTAHNLADAATGRVASVLGGPPNGSLTSTMRTFNSLANMLAACVRDADRCSALFAAADPLRGPKPRDTLEAMVDIAHDPSQRVADLFAVSQAATVYQPALTAAEVPDAWTLAVRYQGDGPLGQELDGPGNIAFDRDGNAWVTNNYDFSLDPLAKTCGSNKVVKLTPTGGSAPGAPYHGGGLYGAGYGITLDPDGNVWVGNFGFQGTTCELPPPPSPLSMSVSKFSADGLPLSPPDGIRKLDLLNQPQGTVSDRQGNIWVANCSGKSVTVIPAGDPGAMRNIEGIGSKPFDLAFDTRGHAWVTVNNEAGDDSAPGGGVGSQAGTVVELAPDGSIVGDPIGAADGIWRPMGVATDSRGNAWVSNSGLMDPPCEGTLSEAMIPPDEIGEDGEHNAGASVTLIRPLGQSAKRAVTTFGRTETDSRGGLAIPWGIAIDGDDNVWISNFQGQQLTQLCGVRPGNCPPGKRTGDPISPGTGYTSDGLVRNTAVEIDPSGNVWVTNNWILQAEFQTNPGGHEVVVFIGLAAPVKTPLIGPPERP